ncbi:YALIA101S01e06810g1_1 [Yarrowia lipolytica]|nr:YALIA101S01e06810g1_1 [Yarrowia lipolytica]
MDVERSPLKEKTNLKPRRILAKDFEETAQIYSRHSPSPPPSGRMVSPKMHKKVESSQESNITSVTSHSQASIATADAFKSLSRPDSSEGKDTTTVAATTTTTNSAVTGEAQGHAGDLTMHDISATHNDNQDVPLEASQAITKGDSDKENHNSNNNSISHENDSSSHSPTPKRNNQVSEQAYKRLKLENVTLKPFIDPNTVLQQRCGPKKDANWRTGDMQQQQVEAAHNTLKTIRENHAASGVVVTEENNNTVEKEDQKQHSLLLPGERVSQARREEARDPQLQLFPSRAVQEAREIKVPNEYEDHFRMIQQSKMSQPEKIDKQQQQLEKQHMKRVAIDNLEEWRSKWRPIMRNAQFYFLKVSQSNIDRVKPLLDHIGSNISHFFENKINYIVTRQSFADQYKDGKLEGLPPALLTAHKLQLKVWGYEKLEKFLRHLLGETFVDNALGVAGGNKDVGLGFLLKEERVAGPSDRDPEAHRQDFHYLRGPHVYIWDLDKSMRSIMIKEYNKDDFPIWCDNFMGKHQFLRAKDAQKRAESMTAKATRSNSGMKDILASGVQPISNSRSIAQSGDAGLRNGLAPVVASVPSRQVSLMKRNIMHEPYRPMEREATPQSQPSQNSLPVSAPSQCQSQTSIHSGSAAFKRPSMRQNSTSSFNQAAECPTKLTITEDHLHATAILLPNVAAHILNTRPVVAGIVDLAELVMCAVLPQYAERSLLDRRFVFRVIINEGIERRLGHEIDENRREYDRLELHVASVTLFFAKMVYKYSHLESAWDYASLYLYDELMKKNLCEAAESRELFDCSKLLQCFDAARTIPTVPEPQQERKAWCENCKQEFTSFKDHVNSRTHRRFAMEESNFAHLDDFIGRMKSRDSHLSI